MKKKHLTRVGSGCYADVFAHPQKENRVVKVFSEDSDRGYARFLRMLLNQKKKNPAFPRIYNVTKMNGYNYNFTIVEMERLQSARNSVRGADFKELVDFLESKEKLPVGNLRPSERKAAEKVKRMGEVDVALYGDNIMYRPSSGHLVITDPFYGE